MRLAGPILVLLWAFAYAFLTVESKKLMMGIAGNPTARDVLGVLLSWRFLTCVFLYGVSATLYLAALRIIPLSVAGPGFLAIGSVVAFLLGVMWFSEAASTLRLSGIALILAGTVVLFISGPPEVPSPAPAERAGTTGSGLASQAPLPGSPAR